MQQRKQQNDNFEQPQMRPPSVNNNPMNPPKKKVMRTFEWLALFLCIAIVGIVALHEGGFQLIQKTESVEIVERPIETRKQAQPVRYRDETIDRKVDEVLRDISRELSDEGEGKKRVSKKDLRKKGLDNQEANYINKVKKEHQEKGTLENARDWYNVLKTSHETYSKVKNIFDGTDGDKDATIDKNMINDILNNDMLSNSVFSQLEQKFNIPKERSEAFAKAGQKHLDDWAVFVEENKTK